MASTVKKVKVAIRWLHFILGLVIMCYIYSPFHEMVAFQIAMKFFIIPIIAFTGIWLWKFKAINKFFGIQEAEHL